MKNLSLCLILIFLIVSCKKDKENAKLQSGQFSFSKLENYNSTLKFGKTQKFTSSSVVSQNQYSFNLGELKTSKSFYFLLLNVGDLPIYNISLTTDNPNFIISPSKISYLGSTKNLSVNDSNLIFPIITLGIEHGQKINGNGYGTLLDTGINTCTITIKGKTILNNDTVLLSISPTMLVNAKLMDIKFFVNNQEINLYNPSGSLTTAIRGIGTIPYYYTDFMNKPVKIMNTGNTTITLQILGNTADTITLEPDKNIDSLKIDGQSMVFTIGNTTSGGYHAVFILNSDGTAVINNKLKLLDDGNAYFSLFHWE